MSEKQIEQEVEVDLCLLIFSVSAALLGVCLTVLGIFKLLTHIKELQTYGDELLAINAALFLFSCLLAYWALRARGRRRMRGLEILADVVFLVALCMMALICGLITYALV
jgi:hypothetical protein